MQPGPHGSSFYLHFCQYLKSRIYLSSNYKTPNLAAELCQWTIIHMYKLVSQIHRLSTLPFCSSLVLFCSPDLQSQIFSCLLRLSTPSPLLSLQQMISCHSTYKCNCGTPSYFHCPSCHQGKIWKKWPFWCPGLTPSVLRMCLLLKPWFTNHPLSSTNPAMWLPVSYSKETIRQMHKYFSTQLLVGALLTIATNCKQFKCRQLGINQKHLERPLLWKITNWI